MKKLGALWCSKTSYTEFRGVTNADEYTAYIMNRSCVLHRYKYRCLFVCFGFLRHLLWCTLRLGSHGIKQKNHSSVRFSLSCVREIRFEPLSKERPRLLTFIVHAFIHRNGLFRAALISFRLRTGSFRFFMKYIKLQLFKKYRKSKNNSSTC